MDDALQITRRLVEEVATSSGDHEGVELSFHDIEKAYPRVCRSALWDLLSRPREASTLILRSDLAL